MDECEICRLDREHAAGAARKRKSARFLQHPFDLIVWRNLTALKTCTKVMSYSLSMKTTALFPTLLFVAGLAGSTIFADDVVKPTPFPAASSPSPSADQASVDEPSVIDHVVYLAKLPSPDELMKGAELKATPIVRMDQTADRIVVVYQYGGGRQVTFAYTLLSKAGSSSAPAAPTSSATYSVVTPTPAPPATTTTVVYSQPREVYYYEPRVRYYDPAWDFWTPLAVGIGLGWGFGGHGHYHGGGHGHGWHH